jgi:feruloyl esterase
MRTRVLAITFACVAAAPGAGKVAARTSCEGLSALAIPHVAITLAQPVAPGALVLSGGGGSASQYSSLPAFCRVAATLTPSADSDIKVEIWLPQMNWNRKFEAVGNGGWAGSISYAAMADALRRGYATASTDTGHAGGGASFALGHPEKLIDYSYRSEHEMTATAKAVIAAFYGNAPQLSYWNGCSAGGKQGLKEAQKYPGDFDGIVAGAPAANWSGRAAQSIWINRAVHGDEAAYIPPSKYAVIHAAVLEACDGADGVKDGVLEDPTRCTFDPELLECKSADDSSCLTRPQVEAARKIYSAAVNPRTKQEIFPGHERGSELGWATMAGPQPFAIGLEFFRFAVFQDPTWDPGRFDFDRDYARAQRVAKGEINALDPNLRPFFARGGRLIQYHGWSDPQISPRTSVEYHDAVVATLGRDRVSNNYRLFMVPGMAHCRGGEGTDRFDMMSALENWVEKGTAPDRISASRAPATGRPLRTRPLCPYPLTARYNGSGSIDDERNFTCRIE